MTSSILPKYSTAIYAFNPQTRYFSKSRIECQETPLNRLPLELRIAPAGAANVKVNACKLLLSKERINRKYKFITGIQETQFVNWFLGNDCEYCRGTKILSIILFRFVDNDCELHVYYFHKYDRPNTMYRLQFANSIIPVLTGKAEHLQKYQREA